MGATCAPTIMLPEQKSIPAAEALGRSQGKPMSKIYLHYDGKGKPITFLLTPGQQPEITMAERLFEQGTIRRGYGRLRICPKRVACGR